jgi:hypothetical protein
VNAIPSTTYLVPLAESYRRLPRRVGPWIDPDEFLPPDRPALLLPAPSEKGLRALHVMPWVQRLAAVLDQRLAVALERPAVRHIADGREGHAVVVLFVAVVEIWRHRIIRTSLAPLESTGAAWRESTLPWYAQLQEPAEFSVSPLPFRELWMARYRDGVALHLRQQLGGLADRLADRYAAWLACQMLRRHWTHEQRRRVRTLVDSALDLDREALQLARRASPGSAMRAPVSAWQYQRALDNADEWNEVRRAAPGLLPLFALVQDALPPQLEPLPALRAWLLHDERIRPRHWHSFLHDSMRWAWRLRNKLFALEATEVRDILASAVERSKPANRRLPAGAVLRPTRASAA